MLKALHQTRIQSIDCSKTALQKQVFTLFVSVKKLLIKSEKSNGTHKLDIHIAFLVWITCSKSS